MKSDALNYFGRVLMERVRDAAIRHWDMVITGKMKDAGSKEVYDMIRAQGQDAGEAIKSVIPGVVDTCIHNLLRMLEEEQERIKVAVRAGELGVADLAETSDGLTGELYGEKGWIRRLSRERARWPAL
jgi:hypothetical protein